MKSGKDVYDKKKKRTIASIAGDDTNILQQDLGMPTKLGEMITDYAKKFAFLLTVSQSAFGFQPRL